MSGPGVYEAVRFEVQPDEQRAERTRPEIESAELFNGATPVRGGVYDTGLGTPDMHYNCTSCGLRRGKCPGHPGRFRLNVKVLLPLTVSEVRHWLRTICLQCGAPMVDPAVYARVAAANRLAEASKKDPENMTCRVCRAPHPKIVQSATDYYSFVLEYAGRRGYPIYPHQIAAALERVSDGTVAALGRDPQKAHPRRLVISTLEVPSVTIRPGVRVAGGSHPSSLHDVNSLLRSVVTQNNKIGDSLLGVMQQTDPATPIVLTEQQARAYLTLQMVVYELLQGSSGVRPGRGGAVQKRGLRAQGRDVQSIARRLPRKPGRLRNNLLGKRAFGIGRDTISGNSQLAVDEVGIPQGFARRLQVQEHVQTHNIDWLMPFFMNGRRQYPGASRVRRRATGAEHDVAGLRGDFRLEVGDVLWRDAVTGDLAFFNRQPSLERSALGVHRVVVLPPNAWTIQMNVIACKWYGADFDGDQMSVFVLGRAGPRAEGEILAAVHNAFISTKNSTPVNGMVEDSLVGTFQLTREATRMDRRRALRLFAGTRMAVPRIPAGTVSGWDAMSALLTEFPVSYAGEPSWFRKVAAAHVEYRPAETFTEVSHGKVLGLLDKAAVGSGARGGVFHRISRRHGTAAALRAIFAMQQVAIAHSDARGFSMGLPDMLLPAERVLQSRKTVEGLLADAEEINRRLVAGRIVPPLGMSIHEFYERSMVSALAPPDELLDPITEWLDPDTNGFWQMASCGSKGKVQNMIHTMTNIGQVTIDGHRVSARGFGRTLPYFARGDLTPQAAGFIAASYIGGLTGPQYVYGAMNARFDLSSKALTTATSGYTNRKAVFGLQSLITDHHRGVEGPGLVQLVYGDDGMDARHIDEVPFPTTKLGDADVEARFECSLLPEAERRAEVQQLLRDRDAFRRMSLLVEETNFGAVMKTTAPLPVNVRDLAEELTGETAPGAPALLALHEQVQAFCAELPRLFRSRRATGPVPLHLTAAVSLLAIHVRQELCCRRLLDLRLDENGLFQLFALVRAQFRRALVSPGEAVGILAAQAVSEHFTQYLLDSHHRSVTGGTTKAGILRPQEIFGAKPVEKERSAEMLPFPRGGSDADGASLARGLAENIKILSLRQLVAEWQLLYEDFSALTGADAADLYPDTAEDRTWAREYVAVTPLLRPPGDLTNWCCRFRLDRMALVLKRASLETVVTRLRATFPQGFVVHAPETSADIIVRVFLRHDAVQQAHNETKTARAVLTQLLDAPLRGVAGVHDARVVQVSRHVVGADGRLEQKKLHAVRTTGTNLGEALCHPLVAPHSALTSSIGDTLKVLGIEAARARAVNAIRDAMGGNSPGVRHLQIYADQMTRTGKYTSLERGGVKQREANNVLLRAGMHEPVGVFREAALSGLTSPVYGVATPLILGDTPRVGSGYTRLIVDAEFVSQRRQSAANIIDNV